MSKFFAADAIDQAFDHVKARGTRLCLCAGAPASAADAITTVGAGGAMLGDLQLTAASKAKFAVTTAPGGARKLTIGGQNEIIGHEAGIADHLALVDTAGGEILVLTELTEDQPVLPAAIIATRSFSVILGTP